jgi:predicted Zn finger-like uncharacterized protein
MLIVCPSCASEYIVDPAQIRAEGLSVRCAACRESFFVFAELTAGKEEPAEPPPFDAGFSMEPALAVEASANRAGARAAARPVAAKRARRRSPACPTLATRPRSGAGIVMGAALVMLAVGLVGRERIVQTVPSTARLYAAVKLPANPTGLAFNAVRSELVVEGSDKLLVVEGEIRNLGGKDREVPRLEVSVRGPDGLPLYTWTNEAPRKTLGATESARFRARLASPPAEGREVLVRFAQAPGRSTVSARAP